MNILCSQSVRAQERYIRVVRKGRRHHTSRVSSCIFEQPSVHAIHHVLRFGEFVFLE